MQSEVRFPQMKFWVRYQHVKAQHISYAFVYLSLRYTVLARRNSPVNNTLFSPPVEKSQAFSMSLREKKAKNKKSPIKQMWALTAPI